MKNATGVNKKKNIMPKTIGFTIIPSISPKFIHNLLSGSNALGLKRVIDRKIAARKINR
jgi:hypothetical protein